MLGGDAGDFEGLLVGSPVTGGEVGEDEGDLLGLLDGWFRMKIFQK